MTTLALADLMKVMPLVDAWACSDAECLLLVSHPADPALDERLSALVLVNRQTSEGALLGEFPGASELVLWTRFTGPQANGLHALVASPGGHLWELMPGGRVQAIRDAFGSDGPLTYGFLNCATRQSDQVYIGGMSNQLYRLPEGGLRVERADAQVLDRDMADEDSAIYGMADMDGQRLLCVGGGGKIFWMDVHGVPHGIDSGTNVMINAVAALDAQTFVACGAGGLLLQGDLSGWCQVEDSDSTGTYFSAVKTQGQRLLWIGGQRLHASMAGDTWFELKRVPDAPGVSRFARGAGSGTWALGPSSIGWTGDGERWAWLPTASVRIAAG
ncbi:hypothetical protein [Piscinibacter terrae]|uniref:hypothetical protein n=1 Tax=Piscinibacter terrae TaxID=2496871 RepID=UPI000F599C2E|nr:hypothetical protein [Albitalea terrae]